MDERGGGEEKGGPYGAIKTQCHGPNAIIPFLFLKRGQEYENRNMDVQDDAASFTGLSVTTNGHHVKDTSIPVKWPLHRLVGQISPDENSRKYFLIGPAV